MAGTKQLITWQRINAAGELDTLYPKTTASQVFINAGETETLADHVASDIHLTATERAALTATNNANGYVKLDANGEIPRGLINPADIAVKTEFANVAAMLAGADDVKAGQVVMVLDASADTTVTSGWAIYRKKVTADDYTTLDGWQKIAEAESLDVVVSWDNIQNKPSSTVADIDDAVSKKHAHANKAVIDEFGDSGTAQAPVLTYKTKTVAFTDNVIQVRVVEASDASTVAAGLKEGDMLLVVPDTTPEP